MDVEDALTAFKIYLIVGESAYLLALFCKPTKIRLAMYGSSPMRVFTAVMLVMPIWIVVMFQKRSR